MEKQGSNDVYDKPGNMPMANSAAVNDHIANYIGQRTRADIASAEKKNRRPKKIAVALGIAALVAAGLAACKTTSEKDSDNSMFATAYEAKGCGDDFATNTVDSILHTQGFSKGDYEIVNDINKEINVNGPGGGALTDDPINSLAEYGKWINSGTPAANAYVENIAKQSGDTVDEVKQGGNRTVFVQFKEPTILPGNTMYKDGQVVDAGKRLNEAGDATLIYVGGKACTVSKTSTKPGSNDSLAKMSAYTGVGRAGCANPQTAWPIPTPNPKPPHTLTPKDPREDVNKNPDVPKYVRGPGTTPVGQNPGPAHRPSDKGNGGAPAQAAKPKHNNPPSGGGSGNSLPAPTEKPAPAHNAPKPNAPAHGNPEDF